MQLTQRILGYDQHLSEGEYLDDLAAIVVVDDLFAATVELLQSPDAQTLSINLLFVQDLILWNPDEARKFIRNHYPESIVVTAIESLLWSKYYWIRKQAAYVLGKTCSYGSVQAMTAAFEHFIDRDPILLPRLMGEMGWLGAENFYQLLDRMIGSNFFVTRWAAICLLEEFLDEPDTEIWDQKRQRWELLRQDIHPLVQRSAATRKNNTVNINPIAPFTNR